VGLFVVYFFTTYLIVPFLWRIDTRHRHRDVLTELPRVTHTGAGLSGDPLNVALVGSEDDVVTAMLRAEWHPADPITLRSSLRIAASTVFRRPYVDAPVSNLYVWNRKQDLAFERPAGEDARRRHHVRFWKAPQPDDDGRPFWIGDATFDARVEISRTTGQFTHRIDPNIDAERDKLLADLRRTGSLERVDWVDHFQTKLTGRNGGGDPYYTSGRLAVGILVPAPTPIAR
jgi:hypothetical protein